MLDLSESHSMRAITARLKGAKDNGSTDAGKAIPNLNPLPEAFHHQAFRVHA